MLLLVTSIKLVAEVALCALAGQWLLGLLVGARRDQNVFYQVLMAITRPLTRLFRAITPRVVMDRHIPLLAFLALCWIWVFALIEKVGLCRLDPAQRLCQ